MSEVIFFDGWSGLIRIAVITPAAYLGVLVLLRVSGKRAVGKMNLFDFVFVIALGSLLASTLLGGGVTLAEGLWAIAALLLLHYLTSVLVVHSPALQAVITGEPALLLRNGKPLRQAMRRERVTEEQLHAALRARGVARVEEVAAVVLETDGTFSIIKQTPDARAATAMTHVKTPGEGDGQGI